MIAIDNTSRVQPTGRVEMVGRRKLVEIRCECGVVRMVRSDQIVGRKYCGVGCSLRKREVKVKHGLHAHRLYQTWLAMVVRCTNPKSISYRNYGARGIRVCDRWLSVANFIEDMWPTYSEGMQLDRNDVDGNYQPSNCRWVTTKENSQNRRDSYSKRFNAPKDYRDQAIALGINPNSIGYRLKVGMRWEDAISKPIKQR